MKALTKKSYHAALYMRLSKDDDGVSESASISTQRKMLHAYAKEHAFRVYGEYADDGWSGTNFDRPGWQQMVTDIEDKKINMVITKDLSRLGRDYISVGQYTEIYFPSKGVRCIAVNDGYDSDSPYTDIAPFKNIINELYARDTSNKIRSAFRTKMQDGAFIGNFAPYGYIKDPADKNHLLVDHAAAQIVREMFQMAENGYAPSKIAKTFNNQEIMTPSMYRCSKRIYFNRDDDFMRKEWTSAIVCKMLRNIVYLGHIAQGKTTKVSFKSHITMQNPRDEWIVVENLHEPLISQETYDNVRKRSVARRAVPNTDFSNIFSGIAKCADCGRNMSATGSSRKGGSYNLVCGGYKLYGSGKCSNHFIDYEIMYYVVLQEFRQLLVLTDEDRQEIMSELEKIKVPKEKSVEITVLVALQKREQELDRIIGRLYEDNIGGQLDDTCFYRILAGYEAEQKDIAVRLASFVQPAETVFDEKAKSNQFLSMLNEAADIQKLTPELLRKLVDKIEICQGEFEPGKWGGHRHLRIKIHYKFICRIEKPV